MSRARGAVFTRSTIELLTRQAVRLGAKGMAWILYRENGEINSILPKYFEPEVWRDLEMRMDARPGDFILFCADGLEVVRARAGRPAPEMRGPAGTDRPWRFPVRAGDGFSHV